jgi:hypothetical protein
MRKPAPQFLQANCMTMRPACLFDPDERIFLESINPRRKINPPTGRIPGTY